MTAIPAPFSRLRELAPGVGLAVAIGLVALWLGRRAPLIGGPVLGIVLGIIVRNLTALPVRCRPGITFTGKKVLQWSIIALGFGLSLDQVARTGAESLSVTLLTMSAAFIAAWLLGRWLRVPGKLAILIGVALLGGVSLAAAQLVVPGRAGVVTCWCFPCWGISCT